MALVESRAMDLALTPLRAAISKPARRAYISTILFLATSFVLLLLSTVAYILFYLNYIPSLGFSHTLHLQFPAPSPHRHPYALLPLAPSTLVPNQPYDIHLTLSLPRSPPNLQAGNFMLDLSLLSSALSPSSSAVASPSPISHPPPSDVSQTPNLVLHRSVRPAILTYTSPLLSHLSLLTFSPLYILGLRREEETLSVQMFESVQFARGWKNLPSSLRLELQTPSSISSPASPSSTKNLEVYTTTIHFTARLRGLRYMMYHHRLLSLVLFVTSFYLTALLSTAAAWVLLAVYLPSRLSTQKIKSEPSATDTDVKPMKAEPADDDITDATFDPDAEDYDLSDTPRTFPPYSSRFAPLRYPPAGSSASASSQGVAGPSTAVLGGENGHNADEEDAYPAAEGARGGMFGIEGLERRGDGRGDSGIGTSVSESVAGTGREEGLQRRRSGGRRS